MKPSSAFARRAPQDSDARPSKSQRKREMDALQKLGVELLGLGAARLERLDLPDALRDALAQAARITSHEARRRHLQYIGRLMRDVDAAPLARAVADATGASRAAVAVMHRCEQWRARLLEDDAALTELLTAHPRTDAQQLRALIRAARRERDGALPPRHARALYRWLHEALAHEGTTTTSG